MPKTMEMKIHNVNQSIGELQRKYKKLTKLYDLSVQKMANMEVEVLSTNASLKFLCAEDIGKDGTEKTCLTDAEKRNISDELYEKYKKEALEQAEKDDGMDDLSDTPFQDKDGDVVKEPIRYEFKGYDLTPGVKA